MGDQPIPHDILIGSAVTFSEDTVTEESGNKQDEL